jgi:uncharacterized DUF497 family protein
MVMQAECQPGCLRGLHITFDLIKEAINIRKHGLLLQEAENLEWDIAFAWIR